jgi:hypothetical protein
MRAAVLLLAGFVLFTMPATRAAAQFPEDARFPAPLTQEQVHALLAGGGVRADSCRPAWDSPVYYLWDWAQQRCEATLCEIAQPEPISAVGVVWFNYGVEPAEKPVRIFVCADAGGMPGAVLWSAETTTSLLPDSATTLVLYPIDPPLGPLAAGPVWFGHEEIVSGPPSSLFDEMPQGIHAGATPPCAGWNEQILGDYLQLLVVGAPASSVPVTGADLSSIRLSGLENPVSTTLRFSVRPDRDLPLRIDLISPAGRRLETVSDGLAEAGREHTFSIDTSGIPSGLYFLRLEGPGTRIGRKVLVVH